MDQERFMDILACYGPAVLSTIVGDFSNQDSDDDTDEQSLFQLIKKKYDQIGKPNGDYQPNCLLKPDPLPPLPPEGYRRRLTKMKRRQLFFKQLQRRDILYLQVLTTDDKESYKCLVLAKHGDLAQLDDLSLVMHFPKLGPELELLKGDLSKFDLIRGAFWSCFAHERKLFVTLDTQIFDEEEREKIPKLGIISRTDLPSYVRSYKVGMSYAGYVQRSSGYKKENYCMNQFRECLGIDTSCVYSFFDQWNEKTYPESEMLDEIQKKLTPDASTKNLIKSFEFFKVGNMYKALGYANKAISLNPDNIQARVTRGTVYANLGKLRKAFVDTVDSLKLDCKNDAACKQMSELLVAASKTHLKKKNYVKWFEYLAMAKNYNPNNRDAQELWNCARFETSNGVNIPAQPLMAEVLPIYTRLLNDEDKKRRIKQYKRLRKRKHKQNRRHHRSGSRHKSKQRAIEQPQPIPTTTTIRRQVFRKPGAPVFRRPFPPSNPNPRS